LLAGTLSSIGMWAWVVSDPSALRYIALSSAAKPMAENMFRALWSFLVTTGVVVVVSLFSTPKPAAELDGLVYGATKLPAEDPVPFYRNEWFWTVIAILAFIALNIYFW